jgi:hypothetical protein
MSYCRLKAACAQATRTGNWRALTPRYPEQSGKAQSENEKFS